MTESKLKQSAMDSVGEIKMSANDKQVAGNHYKEQKIQPWDYIIQNNIGYMEGNIIKYVSRWKEKGGVADLQKAKHYLEKLIEITEGQSISDKEE